MMDSHPPEEGTSNSLALYRFAFVMKLGDFPEEHSETKICAGGLQSAFLRHRFGSPILEIQHEGPTLAEAICDAIRALGRAGLCIVDIEMR